MLLFLYPRKYLYMGKKTSFPSFPKHELRDCDSRALYQEISNNHPPSSSAPGSTENRVLFQAAYVIGELYRPRGAFQLSFKAIPQTRSLFAYQADPSIESTQVKRAAVCVFSHLLSNILKRERLPRLALWVKSSPDFKTGSMQVIIIFK